MSQKEREPPSAAVSQETRNRADQVEGIAEHLRRKKEEQLTQIEAFAFTDVGYTKEDVRDNEQFRNAFGRYLEESQDDPKKFLEGLAAQGIRIVERSSFLSSQQ